MALNYLSRYPNQIASDPTNYPYGKARNVTTSGDGTGTPWEQDLLNDIFGFHQALLAAASVTPSGTPDTAVASQYLAALQDLFAPKQKFIVAEGSPSGFTIFARTANTYAAISNADFNVSNTQVGDIVKGEYLLSLTLASGSCIFKLDCNDNTTTVASLERQISQQGPVILPFRYVVANAGVAGVIPSLKGDGASAATVLPFYGSGLFCRYTVIRP